MPCTPSVKLSVLASNLSLNKAPGRRWLCTVRHAVAYSQKHGTRYPDSGQQKYFAQLSKKVEEWTADPRDPDPILYEDKNLMRFRSRAISSQPFFGP
jgi:hypothetical protein